MTSEKRPPDVPAKRCTACGEPTDDKPECSERCFGIAHPRPASALPPLGAKYEDVFDVGETCPHCLDATAKSLFEDWQEERRRSASDSRELEIERNKRVSAERKLREMPIGDRRRAERLVKDVEVLTLALHASGDMLKHQLASAYESLVASRKAESRLAKTVARYRGRETGSACLSLTHDEAQRLRETIMGDEHGGNRDACRAAFKKLEAFVLAKWDSDCAGNAKKGGNDDDTP